MNAFVKMGLVMALALPLTVSADCKFQQSLTNNNKLDVSSTLQLGGVTAAQAMELMNAVCSDISQNLTNNGNASVSSTLQLGGTTALQYARIGSSQP
jgi:hypothetical protein